MHVGNDGAYRSKIPQGAPLSDKILGACTIKKFTDVIVAILY
jgi:hypothetical protein